MQTDSERRDETHQDGAVRRRDPLYVILLFGIGAVTLWLLLMPWVPSIAAATLKRFHLTTSPFAIWAAQAPIPAMYNCANQYEIRDLPEGLFTPVLDSSKPRYINHFPTRVLTFANGRYELLHPGQDRWVTLRSTYRGQTLVTKIHAKPVGEGRFEWVRESSEFIESGEAD